MTRILINPQLNLLSKTKLNYVAQMLNIGQLA